MSVWPGYGVRDRQAQGGTSFSAASDFSRSQFLALLMSSSNAVTT